MAPLNYYVITAFHTRNKKQSHKHKHSRKDPYFLDEQSHIIVWFSTGDRQEPGGLRFVFNSIVALVCIDSRRGIPIQDRVIHREEGPMGDISGDGA